MLHHLPFQLVDLLLQRFWRHLHGAKPGRLNGLRFTAPFGFSFRQALAQLQDIHHFLVEALRYDAMLFVITLLFLPSTLGLANGFGHGRGDLIAVKDGLAVDVSRRAADGLDKRAFGAQEALFIGIQDRHQRHLRHIQPLTQQVDPYQHVKLAKAQVADNLHALDGVDIRVQIAHPLAVLLKILG